MNEIKIVCFDAGGVLVRICRSWEEGCRAVGLDVRPRDDSDEAKSRRRSLNAAYQSGEIDCDAFFGAMSDASGGLYTSDEIRRVHDAWIVEEYDGVRDLVGEIHDAGHVTGLLSNTNASHWAQMREQRSMVITALRHQHASHLLGCVKPDETIYRAFESVTGFAGSEILFFDDLADNIDAARRAGWQAHQIDHAGDTASQMRAHLCSLGMI